MKILTILLQNYVTAYLYCLHVKRKFNDVISCYFLLMIEIIKLNINIIY